jgi:hypothetical protein
MPNKSTLAAIFVFALLFVGLIAVYGQQLPPRLGGRPALAASDAMTYVTDLDFWQRTPRERIVVANTRFDLNHDLNSVPLSVGDWTGKDAPETNQEVMILLDPEQYVQRLYQDPAGRYIWLTMVGGRSSQPFHAPDICYDADGWQYNLGSQATSLAGGGDIYGLYLDATKDVPGEATPWHHVVYYFYLFPDDSRDQNDGIVLFKLTAPKYGTVEETLAMLEDFTRNFFSVASAPDAAPTVTPEAATASADAPAHEN